MLLLIKAIVCIAAGNQQREAPRRRRPSSRFWGSGTPLKTRRKLRSPPKIADVNRSIFDCTGHLHIAAVPSALRYRELVLRRGYRGVHMLYDRPYGTLTGGCTCSDAAAQGRAAAQRSWQRRILLVAVAVVAHTYTRCACVRVMRWCGRGDGMLDAARYTAPVARPQLG